jgi:HlyD family secretion protein
LDIPRPEFRQRKRIRRALMGSCAALLIVAAAFGVFGLESAVPAVPRSSVWVDTVRQGEMLRQVRGSGTLVPREVRWIAAQTAGRIERIIVRPGGTVEPDTVLIEMSNADLMQQSEEARLALEGARADSIDTEFRLKGQQLDQQSTLGAVRAEYEGAQLQAEAEKQLVDEGIVPVIQYKRSLIRAEELELRMGIEQQRLDQFSALMDARIAAQRARVAQARSAYERRIGEIHSLQVKAGIAGVLQEVNVEEGQRIELGTNVARVARPDELRAELRVPETQARDVLIGQAVEVDTRNGIIQGRVVRIDPAVQAGTVLVDVELFGPMPRGARPDLSVDGAIEIERLPNAVFTGRPGYGQANSTISMFKLMDSDRYAMRVSVEIGRSSVNAVEIVKGLVPGEQVILSDISPWDDYDRIRLD